MADKEFRRYKVEELIREMRRVLSVHGPQAGGDSQPHFTRVKLS